MKHKNHFYTSLFLVGTLAIICNFPLSLQAEGDKNLSAPTKASQKQDCVNLIAAVDVGNVAGVKALLDKGVDIECLCGDFGDTPLMQAASGGSMEIVKLLVSRGANINPKGMFHGHTPLTRAALNRSLDVVKFLIEHGADVNANCTEHGHSGYLASEGIGPRNLTPLGAAAEGKATAVIEYLLQHGAKVNGRDGSSYTPLMWACAEGDAKTVQVLLDYGSDVTVTTDRGQTARSFAAARNYTDVLALLDAVGKK